MKAKLGTKLSSMMFGSVLALLLVFLMLPAMRTEAASVPVCEKEMTVYFTDNENIGSILEQANLFIGKMTKNAKIQNIKSSNKKIYADTTDSLYTNQLILHTKYYHDLKNNEKTTISFTVVQGGKKYKLSCKVTFKKLSGTSTQVLSSLKLGGKEYIRKAEAVISNGNCLGYYLNYDADKYKTKKIKLEIKMKKGYQLDCMELYLFPSGRKMKKNGCLINKNALDTITIYWRSSTPKYFDQSKLNKKKAKELGYTAAQAAAHTIDNSETYYAVDVPVGA